MIERLMYNGGCPSNDYVWTLGYSYGNKWFKTYVNHFISTNGLINHHVRHIHREMGESK